jgi:hypothetical protein
MNIELLNIERQFWFSFFSDREKPCPTCLPTQNFKHPPSYQITRNRCEGYHTNRTLHSAPPSPVDPSNVLPPPLPLVVCFLKGPSLR